MLNDDRSIALENLMILSEGRDARLEIRVEGLALKEGVDLVEKLTGLPPTIHFSQRYDRFVLTTPNGIPDVTVVCLPVVDVSPFDRLPLTGRDEEMHPEEA